jgi:molybdate transport system substrate-binding protein
VTGRIACALAMLVLLCFATTVTVVQAAEVKCLCPLAMEGVLKDLAPDFERVSKHKLVTDLATLGVNAERVAKGAPADVVVVLPAQADELEKQGRLLKGTRKEIARVGYGVVVRNGAAKPDLSSVDALKRTLLAAKSISYGDPAAGGPSGAYVKGLIDRLGLTAELKPKTKLVQNAELVIPAVVNGDAEIGFTLAATGKASTAVDFTPLPAEIQSYTTYVAAIVADSKEVGPATGFIAFFAWPTAKEALKVKGFE